MKRPHRTTPRTFLGAWPVVMVWLAAVAVWIAWAPFAASGGRARLLLLAVGSPLDMLANLALLAPLAMTLVLVDIGPRWKAVLRALIVILFLGTLLEVGQLLIGGRYVQLSDVAFNLVGAGVGTWLVLLLERSGIDRARVMAGIVAVTFVVALLVLGVSARRAAVGFVIEDWSTGDTGEGRQEAAKGKEAVRQPVGEVCAGPSPGRTCVDVPGDRAREEAVARLAEQSQRVALNAWKGLEEPARTGAKPLLTFPNVPGRYPAAILSRMSDSLVLRVHTAITAGHARPQFALPGAFELPPPDRVSASFDRGRITLVAEAGTVFRSANFHMGLLEAWIHWRAIKYLTPRILWWGRLFGALVLALPVGILAAVRFRSVLGALAVGACLPLVIVITADGFLTASIHPMDGLLAGALGAAAAMATRAVPANGYCRSEGGLTLGP